MNTGTLYIPPEALGMTEEQVRDEVLATNAAKDFKHFTPEFVSTKVQELDLGKVREQIQASTDLFEQARIGQVESVVKFETPAPITVFTIGDIHYGSIYTDHDWFHRLIDVIIATPNAYCVFMANMIDNAIPAQFPNNMLVNAIPPDKQVVVMRKISQRLNEAGKLLAVVTSPCHEGWTYKHTGQDINALIYGFDERKFAVLENGGRLHLEFGAVSYLVCLYHQVGPFESNFNKTHALKQLNRLQQKMEADVIVGAHRHFSAVETGYEGDGEHRKMVAYIRSGTAKGIANIRDQFSVGRYGATGEPSGQSFTLWPKVKKLDAHLDFDAGIEAHLNCLRSTVGES